MALDAVVLELLVVALAMLSTAALALIGPRPIVRAIQTGRWRLVAIVPPAAALGIVLLVRIVTQDRFTDFSWNVGVNISSHLFAIEETILPWNPVIVLQSVQTESLTSLAAFIYVYGYVFLLAFPFLAYFALDDERMDRLSSLLLAFTVNYGVGLAFYTLFVAYGPRNYDLNLFTGLLYDAYPHMSHLTHTVNENTNVFPSLHTSMAMTVFFLAWHTRKEYPLWVPLSGALALGVVLSTMYLGIHWFTDVVAGTMLAAISVYIGVNYTTEELLREGGQSLIAAVERLRAAAVDRFRWLRTRLSW
ncbi:phosphatase PAP2 family protein [Halobacteria archaeon AArc-dxtr1]|nr:phosphatase PAP2 family protein [Halobacteria archaeon AArc-dxtr1]